MTTKYDADGLQGASQMERRNIKQKEKQENSIGIGKFAASNFSHVFKRISERKDKIGYFGVRLLNKFHKLQFESKLETMDIQYKDLQSVAESSLADHVRVLNVSILDELYHISQLCYASPTYFPNIQKVNAQFYRNQDCNTQRLRRQSNPHTLWITKPLVFKYLNLSYTSNYNQFYGDIAILGEYDVTIIDSVFQGHKLWLRQNNKVTISGLSLENVDSYGLVCQEIRDKIVIENTNFENCAVGLKVKYCQMDSILKRIKILNCTFYGVQFVNGMVQGTSFDLQNSEIINCEGGIRCEVQDGGLKDYIVRDCEKVGVRLKGSTVHHSGIQFSQNGQNVKLIDESSFINTNP